MNRPTRNESPAALLEHEFAQERASALGRLGRALETALAALAEFDASHPRDESSRAVRKKMVAEASTALWQFVVQREACGMRDMRLVIRDYRVPAEVAAHMGAMPEQPPRRRR
jgi:hypothetical protein